MPPWPLPPLPNWLRRYWLRRDWGWLHLAVGGGGPALFLVHGLGGSGHDFHALARILAQDFTVLIPDLPGFGYSDKPDLPYSPRLFARELAAVAGELGLSRAFWLGHSMGGQVVLTQAVERPGLVRALVGICPSGGHTRADWLQKLLLALFTKPGDHLRLYHPALLVLFVRWCYGDPSHSSRAELTNRVRAQWDSLEGPLLERSFIRSAKALLAEPIWPRLDGLETPVLLVGGSRDRIIPQRDLGRLLGHLPPDTPYELLPCGHLPVYTMPQELARITTRFLRSV